MLKLVNIFDVNKDLASVESDGVAQKWSLKVVGQERDGSVLYTRQAPPPGYQTHEAVTYFEIYNIQNKTSKVLYIHGCQVNVANATVNQEHTFLAFVAIENGEKIPARGCQTKASKYRAFLAEIYPQNRVFDLNLEREFYIKLQFIYPLKDQLVSRESSLLVFLHRDSIGLYRLPTARYGENHVILSGEPRKQQLLSKLWWAQWLPHTQCLYALTFTRSAGKDKRHTPVLTALQVLPDATVEKTMEMELDLPIPYCKLSTRCFYDDCGVSSIITDRATNMSVLALRSGALCVCYRHATPYMSRSYSTSEVGSLNEEQSSLTYSVTILHHNTTLTVQCHGVSVSPKTHVFFSWIGEYVLAYVPDSFTHLLNVSLDVDPSNHIFLDTKCEDCQGQVKSQRSAPLVPFIKEYRPGVTKPALGLYDPSTCCAYKVTVDENLLVSAFAQTTDLPTKLAIMHFTVVHIRDLQLTYDLCEVLCHDVTSLDLTSLLQEFLVGSTFAHLRRKIDDDILRCLPFTTAPVLSSLRYSKDLRITYTPLVKSPKLMMSSQMGAGPMLRVCSTWFNLSEHLQRTRHGWPIRFNYSSVKLFEEEQNQMRSRSMPKSSSRPSMGIMSTSSSKNSKSRPMSMPAFSTSRASHSGLVNKYSLSQPDQQSMSQSLSQKQQFSQSLSQAHSLSQSLSQTHSLSQSLSQSYSLSQSMSQTQQLPQFLSQAPHLSISPSQTHPLPVTQSQSVSQPMSQSTSQSRSSSRPPSRTEQILGQFPSFLSSQDVEPGSEQARDQLLKALCEFLKRHLKKEDPQKIRSIAEEYVRFQAMQSRLLCHSLWSVTHHGDSDSALEINPEQGDNMDLYMVMDKYHLATQTIYFPRPKGFDSFFTVLSVNHLSLSHFLQYIDNGSLGLNIQFVKKLMKASRHHGDDLSSQAIYQLISRLPKADAIQCLRQWNHPLAYSFISCLYTRFCFKQEAILGWEVLSADDAALEAAGICRGEGMGEERLPQGHYAPLSQLLKHMEHSDDGLRRGNSLCGLSVDSDYIRSAALIYSSTQSVFQKP